MNAWVLKKWTVWIVFFIKHTKQGQILRLVEQPTRCTGNHCLSDETLCETFVIQRCCFFLCIFIYFIFCPNSFSLHSFFLDNLNSWNWRCCESLVFRFRGRSICRWFGKVEWRRTRAASLAPAVPRPPHLTGLLEGAVSPLVHGRDRWSGDFEWERGEWRHQAWFHRTYGIVGILSGCWRQM